MNLAMERIYDKRRRQAQSALEARTAALYARVPELAELPKKRQAVFRDVAARRIGASEASARLAAIAERENALLLENGESETSLQPVFHCAECRDTGWLGSAQRRPCACRLLLAAKLDPAIGINEEETFDSYLTDIFPTEEQQRRSVNAKLFFERYADALPAPEKQNVLLLGMAGLGKSFLGNAAAHRALCRGIEARRITAYTLIEDALERIRSRTAADDTLMTVPLLVIDDLGSEPLIPNISEETLFCLLNERLLAKRCTIIATNLSPAELCDRYGERVGSRLIDRNTTQAIQLTGENLRNRRLPC